MWHFLLLKVVTLATLWRILILLLAVSFTVLSNSTIFDLTFASFPSKYSVKPLLLENSSSLPPNRLHSLFNPSYEQTYTIISLHFIYFQCSCCPSPYSLKCSLHFYLMESAKIWVAINCKELSLFLSPFEENPFVIIIC
jgi:hypothetical protein